MALSAALAAGVLAAVALGQEGGPVLITVTSKVKPGKAGTQSHPRGIEVVAQGKIDAPGDTGAPMPQSIDVWLPKGWVYNGAKHPACTLAKLNSGGLGSCPPGAIVSGGEPARADVVDEFNPHPRVAVVNGGRTKVYFWVVLQNPARVQAAAPGTIAKVRSSRWSYRLHVDIPDSLQLVAGMSTTLAAFYAHVRSGDWLATTGCPRDHRWRAHLRLTYASGQVLDTDGSVPCRS